MQRSSPDQFYNSHILLLQVKKIPYTEHMNRIPPPIPPSQTLEGRHARSGPSFGSIEGASR